MPGIPKAIGSIISDGVKAIIRTGRTRVGITVCRCVAGVIASGTKSNIYDRIA